MSGHSKWATTKHRKAATDKARGKLFAKLIRQIEVAAREGGGDPSANATLRTMVEKARDASVPLDTVDRAVKRGIGELEGVRYESVSYEAYAPNGVAVIAECLTDNRNRTTSEVKNVFTRNGGSLAEPGAVAWQFERKGTVVVDRKADEDELMMAALDAGAEDIADEGDAWRVTTAPADVHAVRAAIEAAGMTVESSDSAMVPKTTILLDDSTAAKQVLRLIDALDDQDDVGEVNANFDIPDAILETVEA